jgi:hypothetical protein
LRAAKWRTLRPPVHALDFFFSKLSHYSRTSQAHKQRQTA